MDLNEQMKRALRKIADMTPEEREGRVDDFIARYRREQEERRTPRWEELKRAVAWLKAGNGGLTSEACAYGPGRPLTRDEYRDLTNWLGEAYSEYEVDLPRSARVFGFPESRIAFEYDGFRFLWRHLVGQGSHVDLVPASGRERKVCCLVPPV